MSSLKYKEEKNFKFVKKGITYQIKESVYDGNKGLSIMFLKREGDKDSADSKYYKFYVKEKEGDKNKYILNEKIDGKESEKEIDEKELLKILKTNKLDSISNYITKDRGTYKGKKVSKIASKLSKLLA
jgi:hypothetical protein